MNKLVILFFAFSLFSYKGFASTPTSRSEINIGVVSSVFLGFGTGPAFQKQENSNALLYASTQGLGLVLLFSGAGSCQSDCSSSTKALRISGASLFLASRLLEVIDSSLFAWKFYEGEKSKATVHFIPMNQGSGLATVINF